MIRRVVEDDVPGVVGMVHELADYVRAADQCTLSDERLRAALFAEHPAVFGHVAELGGQLIGTAVWFLTYSTWDGVHGIHLEDLYVQPAHRGVGAGRGLLVALAEECRLRGYSRLQWQVLDWNEPAIGFYRGLGAEAMDEWTMFRLSGAALHELAVSSRR